MEATINKIKQKEVEVHKVQFILFYKYIYTAKK